MPSCYKNLNPIPSYKFLVKNFPVYFLSYDRVNIFVDKLFLSLDISDFSLFM